MGKVRIGGAYAFGIFGILALFAFNIHTDRSLWVPTFVLCLLTMIVDLIPMRLPYESKAASTFSFNSALTIVAILQYDTSVAMVTGAVEIVILGVVTKMEPMFISYNIGVITFTALTTGFAWKANVFFPDQKVVFILLTLLTYLIMNSIFYALGLWIFYKRKFWKEWSYLIKELYQIYLVTEIIGLMIASLIHRYDIGVLFIVTIFIILFYGLLNKYYRSVKQEREVIDHLKDATFKTIIMMASAVDARDAYTHGHSTRVAIYSKRLAQAINLPNHEVENIYIAGVLHDVGKIGISDEILRKPGRLTPEEMDEMKTHPVKGEEILKQWGEYESILPAVRWHHERYDGKGYPDGLVGEETPLIARLLAVCDAFDAMTSDRPYRKGMPIEKALSIIESESGTQFDSELAREFIEMIESMDVEELHEILTTEREKSLYGII